jgi:hypothetical protein
MYLGIITGILVFLLIGAVMSVSAELIPDITGSWTGISVDQYSPKGGFENRTANLLAFLITGQDGRAYIGEETHHNLTTGNNVTELFSGALSPDGQTYELDNQGSGITFGEIVSDHEFYNTVLFYDRDPLVRSYHMVKSGTNASPSGEVPELVGTWNLTHSRNNAASTTGLLTIDQQLGRIWAGTEEFQDEDGTWINVSLAGTVGETGRLYAATLTGLLCSG